MVQFSFAHKKARIRRDRLNGTPSAKIGGGFLDLCFLFTYFKRGYYVVHQPGKVSFLKNYGRLCSTLLVYPFMCVV